VHNLLGQGGYGTVYRARQLAVGREIALKIDSRILATERDRRRFLREVTAAGQLSGHPHVVGLYDAGTLPDGRPYLVMEFCPGGSLESLLRTQRYLPAPQVRDIGVRIADALAATHAAGMLHRDVKPANILVNRYGVVGLSDFGLASILDADGGQSATREALTPAFAAPEAFELAEPAPPADVYSLAATLYTLLCGQPPRFPVGARPSIAAIMRLHHEPVPDLVGVPGELVDVLRAGLIADPGRRLPSASSLRDALAMLRLEDGPPLRSGDAPAGATPSGRPLPRPVRPPRPESEPGNQPPGTRQLPVPKLPVPSTADGAAGTQRLPVHPSLAAQPTLAVPHPSLATPQPTLAAQPAHDAAFPPAGLSRRTTWVAATAAATLIAGSVLAWQALSGGEGSPSGSVAVSAAPVAGGTGPASAGGSGPQRGTSATGSGTSTVAGHPVTSCVATAGIAHSGCPVTSECWGGLVISADVLTGVRIIPCLSPHVWETFAVGALPDDVVAGGSPSYARTAASTATKRLCTTAVLKKALAGPARRIPLPAWQTEILTPRQESFDAGDHAFRCLAKVTGMESTGSAFSASTTAYPTRPWP
jgi:serine/threonine protein kinase